MSQVISRSQQAAADKETNRRQFPHWKKPFLVTLHAGAAATYGYAICWQNVSAASAQLNLISNPATRVFGRWRFLTYNCLIMQFVVYSMCLASHYVPKLRRPRDYFFTTFALPVGMLVVTSFWTIWFVAGREYISPASLEAYYPLWLNHVTHTIIAPINLTELLLVKHQYSTDRKSIVPLLGYMLSYTSYLLFIRYKTGRFVYPFLNKMEPVPVGAFIVGMAVFTVVMYKSGKFVSDMVHGVSEIKDKITGKSSKSTA